MLTYTDWGLILTRNEKHWLNFGCNSKSKKQKVVCSKFFTVRSVQVWEAGIYKDLNIAVSRMWKLRTKIVPVVIGVLRKFKKGLDQNRQLLPGHPSAIGLRKITLMSSAHIMRRVVG